MKAIQKELGDGEDGNNEYTEIEQKISEVTLSKEAKEKAYQLINSVSWEGSYFRTDIGFKGL